MAAYGCKSESKECTISPICLSGMCPMPIFRLKSKVEGSASRLASELSESLLNVRISDTFPGPEMRPPQEAGIAFSRRGHKALCKISELQFAVTFLSSAIKYNLLSIAQNRHTQNLRRKYLLWQSCSQTWTGPLPAESLLNKN
jgi:hypothetical protein